MGKQSCIANFVMRPYLATRGPSLWDPATPGPSNLDQEMLLVSLVDSQSLRQKRLLSGMAAITSLASNAATVIVCWTPVQLTVMVVAGCCVTDVLSRPDVRNRV